MAILARKVDDQIYFLALRNNPTDLKHGGDFYYVVTGSVENESDEDAVRREVEEETGITNIIDIQDLNVVKKYKDTKGNNFLEKIYAVITDQDVKHLSIEHIEYKWLELDEFIKIIYWYDSPKKELKNILYETQKLFILKNHL